MVCSWPEREFFFGADFSELAVHCRGMVSVGLGVKGIRVLCGCRKIMEGWGPNKIRGHFWKMLVKLSPVNSFLFHYFGCWTEFGEREDSKSERKEIGGRSKSIRNVSFTSWTFTIYPPFLQLNFLLRLILGEICSNSFKMREKHFAETGLFI